MDNNYGNIFHNHMNNLLELELIKDLIVKTDLDLNKCTIFKHYL